ncbi:MAG: 2-hydroxymuconate tautomerase [Candidatus Acidiferrales bacterium]
MRRNSEEGRMPYVQVTWVTGRTPEQKRKIIERITSAVVEEGRAKKENVHVTFVDLPPSDYAEAGVTVEDQRKKN